jgi:hypothetical protein
MAQLRQVRIFPATVIALIAAAPLACVGSECAVATIPTVPYINPTNQPRVSSSNTLSGSFTHTGLCTNILLFPYNPDAPAYGLALQAKRYATNDFAAGHSKATLATPWMTNLAGVLLHFRDNWTNKTMVSADRSQLRKFLRGHPDKDVYRRIDKFVEELFTDNFMLKVWQGKASWKHAESPIAWFGGHEAQDGFLWDSGKVSQGKLSVRFEEAAMLLFLADTSERNASHFDYGAFVTAWNAANRDAASLTKWIGLEFKYTPQTSFLPGTAWRWTNGRAAFAQVSYHTATPYAEFSDMTAQYFDRVDAQNHMITDGYAYTNDEHPIRADQLEERLGVRGWGAEMRWRDTLVPVCDGDKLVAVLAINQLAVLWKGREPLPSRFVRQITRENLSNMSWSARSSLNSSRSLH